MPYVELSPGPAINTLGDADKKAVLGIRGAKTYPTDGRLDLTTVSVRDKLTLLRGAGRLGLRPQGRDPARVRLPR